MRIDVSEKVQLTPAQWPVWEETLTGFSWNASCFVHCLYELCNPDKGRVVATFLGTSKVPPWFLAGVNSKRIFLVADRFLDELDLMERIFGLAHEVCHPALGHIFQSAYYRQIGYIEIGFKKMPWDDILANMAQDYVINDLLIQSRIGKFIKGGLHDPTIGTYKDSWIDVYERLYDNQQSKKQGQILGPDGKPCSFGQPGQGQTPGVGEPDKGPPTRNGQKSFDAHMGVNEGEPDPNAAKDGDGGEEGTLGGNEPITQQDMEREMFKAQQAMAAGMQLAQAQGRLPGTMQIFIEKALAPVVTWTDHIRSLFARKLGSGGYDFRRPDRRLLTRDIIVPGRSGHGANLIIGGGDSSGSIYAVPALVARFMGEFGGIMEDVKPREVHVVWCDSAIQRVDVCTDMRDIHKMIYDGVPGGGGTDFRPVFEYVDSLNMEVDALIFLTDGDGTFPDRAPRYPVIWGSIKQPPSHYPFGDVVMIPVPKKVTSGYV